MDIVALLLAAGESERMGSPKGLVSWHGLPLLSHQLQQIQKSRVAECLVVLGRDADRLQPLVQPSFWRGWKARAVYNPQHREGRSSSIVAGLAALPDPPDGIFVVAVDQPADHRLLNCMIESAEEEWERAVAARRRTVVVPAFHGRRGHPPLFHGSLFAELVGISEEAEGLKAVVRRNPARVLAVDWDDAGILLNLNTPLDLPPPDLRRGASR